MVLVAALVLLGAGVFAPMASAYFGSGRPSASRPPLSRLSLICTPGPQSGGSVSGSYTQMLNVQAVGGRAGRGVISATFSRDGTDVTGAGAWSERVAHGAPHYTFDRLRPGDTYTLTAAVDWFNAPGSSCSITVTLPGGSGSPTPTGPAPLPAPTSTTTPLPTPTSTATPLPDPSQALVVAVQPGDTTVAVSWNYTPPAGVRVTRFSSARDGRDTTGTGAWTNDPSASPAVFDKLINGSPYTFTVTAFLSDGRTVTGVAQATPQPLQPPPVPAPPTATPVPVPTITTPPVSTPAPTGSTSPPVSSPPSQYLSGLPWSSGVWADGDGRRAGSFTSTVRGGAPLDNVLVYTSRGSQSAQNNPGSWRSGLPSGFNGARQDLVLGLTSVTEDNASMTAAQARAIGTSLCGLDSTPIVRLDWEMNLADGLSNGAELNGGNYSSWVSRFRTVATNLTAACPGARIDFNPNHGADQTSGCGGSVTQWCSRRAFQELKDVVDIFGVDTYDAYPAVTSQANWNTRLTYSGELDESRRYAAANGKRFSVPEWGVACNGGGCQWQGNAGGDNPVYVHNMLSYFNAHAADMAYDTYFDETASYISSSLMSANPNARAQYRSDIVASSSVV